MSISRRDFVMQTELAGAAGAHWFQQAVLSGGLRAFPRGQGAESWGDRAGHPPSGFAPVQRG